MDWFKPPPHVYLVAAVGICGAGKTTTLEALVGEVHPHFSVEIIPEGLFHLTNYGDFNPLALSYECPNANFAIFQLHAIRVINDIFRRYVGHLQLKYQGRNAPTKEKPLFIVSDRSLFAPLVFIEHARANKIISNFVASFLQCESWKLACKTYAMANLFVRGIFFIDTTPNETYRRILKRGRSYEMNLDLNFVEGLHAHFKRHLAWWRQNPAVTICVSSGSDRRSTLNDLKSMLYRIIQEESLFQE